MYTPRCGTCTLRVGGTLLLRTALNLRLNKYMNCKSNDVIYAMICHKCDDFYIDQTGKLNELRTGDGCS